MRRPPRSKTCALRVCFAPADTRCGAPQALSAAGEVAYLDGGLVVSGGVTSESPLSEKEQNLHKHVGRVKVRQPCQLATVALCLIH